MIFGIQSLQKLFCFIDSEDEEVESINKHTDDQKTVESVKAFMIKVNRIRFISMTATDSEQAPRVGLRRSGSCPTFTEDMREEPQEVTKASLERSASIQV